MRLRCFGNLPYSTQSNELGQLMSSAGMVTNVRLVYDRQTNRPKGFGFCEFADQAGAQNAVNNLNGTEFNGRTLRVNWANK
uniref:RRM domain-containing protein n=1 Tax=Panagrolaimus sp. JU765 TaxID=591449 RepID=A0AC34QN39_9BILA